MVHFGFGSEKSKSFEGIEYSSNSLFIYDDKNYTYYNESHHPQMDGM